MAVRVKAKVEEALCDAKKAGTKVHEANSKTFQSESENIQYEAVKPQGD